MFAYSVALDAWTACVAAGGYWLYSDQFGSFIAVARIASHVDWSIPAGASIGLTAAASTACSFDGTLPEKSGSVGGALGTRPGSAKPAIYDSVPIVPAVVSMTVAAVGFATAQAGPTP